MLATFEIPCELSATQLEFHAHNHMCPGPFGPNFPSKGFWVFPRDLLAIGCGRLAARASQKAAAFAWTLHFVWQSWISEFPYLINIGSGAYLGSLPSSTTTTPT